ncbi:MAG: hypothetical protein A2445_00560 [Candidatus Jacksonbacteria bacterium RIFOXYC2_FULL_44_29]|nr:MAG: hypothetical protein UW45_C0010G0031 [Parcubacteria group bacterium GW2011_GWC2_44_22]OGY76048.1 MAG: hypothetical protein A2295_03775 [Candidatus Jacksonbacteria bacterium RIFOXYB2_FULL_44_15]OGY76351.1 MAG: hypothetical protein A2240_04290 [Candidatus Jacksonbacteria bacterium RIFOXYA2_FULL_43_12]OGY77989.1 MAG: hypothetical protein A2445_00560 [Candidatus Jacksonbacteria bacterium RIFOXYC2_FULL_44_29]OGY80339.1 MAG: hypothetical protein A2550_04525 [Candidatus Jacksonbacteria bacteri
MSYQHQELALGKWFKMSMVEQLANVGSEVERVILWRDKKNEYSQKAFERTLELMDFTLGDPKNRHRLRELARTREALVDYFLGDNDYRSSDDLWRKYFFAFNWAARLGK